MKKLKKLSLKKEEIINLNDFEMNAAKGGTTPSSWPCVESVIVTVGAVVGVAYAGYEVGKENSYWQCPYSQQADCMSDVSKVWVWDGDIRECEIPSVVVYGV